MSAKNEPTQAEIKEAQDTADFEEFLCGEVTEKGEALIEEAAKAGIKKLSFLKIFHQEILAAVDRTRERMGLKQ